MGDTTTLYFDSTGALLYRDIDLIESDTAECPSIESLVPRIRNHENVGIEIGIILARTHERDVELHLRTGTAEGSSGCHDNIGTSYDELDALPQNMLFALPAHLATQGIFSGAGLVTSSDMKFSQKMSTIRHLNPDYNIGLFNAGYAVKRDKGSPLVEVRCNDFNLLDEATKLRVGGSKIAILVGQSSMAGYMHRWTDDNVFDFRQDSARYNQIPLDKEGNFVPNRNILEAVKFQIGLSERFIDGQRHFVDGPQLQELLQIAEQRIACGDAILGVMCGGTELEPIIERVDWAAKLYLIRDLMERGQAKGVQRHIGSLATQAVDLKYDQITISFNDGEVTVRDSLGYALRNRHSPGVRARAAEIAHTPPQSRAAVRAELLKKYEVLKCDWQWLALEGKYGDDIFVRLEDAARRSLLPSQHIELLSARRRAGH